MRNELCKLKFKIENCIFLVKFVLISSLDSILNYISICGCKHMFFFTNFSKIYCSFALNKKIEKSKMAAKMADML